MRPKISDDIIAKVIEKWKFENNIAADVPKTKIIEDILLRFLEEPSIRQENIRDRKRDRLFRRVVRMGYRIIKPSQDNSQENFQ